VQIVTAEGEKIRSNLEQGVLNWFQRREPEGCQKTKGGGLGEVSAEVGCNPQNIMKAVLLKECSG